MRIAFPVYASMFPNWDRDDLRLETMSFPQTAQEQLHNYAMQEQSGIRRNSWHSMPSAEQSGVNKLLQILRPNRLGTRTGREVHFSSRQETESPESVHNPPDQTGPVPASRNVGLFPSFYEGNASKSISSAASLTAGEPIWDKGQLYRRDVW